MDKNPNFAQKSKFWTKIKILSNLGILFRIQILVQYKPFGQRKIAILAKF